LNNLILRIDSLTGGGEKGDDGFGNVGGSGGNAGAGVIYLWTFT
jgi:hypothetical protein